MDIAIPGVDLGKNVCSVVGLDASGAIVMRRIDEARDIDRAGGEASSLRCPAEACCGAHHLGRCSQLTATMFG
jgi:transposase